LLPSVHQLVQHLHIDVGMSGGVHRLLDPDFSANAGDCFAA
jgi:hypothetical protein